MRSLLCKWGLSFAPTESRCTLASHTTSVDATYRTGRDELLETAMALHDAAMKDDYFISRKLAPNVDFWR